MNSSSEPAAPQAAHDKQWDQYWGHQQVSSRLYGRIASFYRRRIIAQSVRRTIRRHMSTDNRVLHLGAGTGEIDALMPHDWTLLAVDFSSEATRLRRDRLEALGLKRPAVQADMLSLPLERATFGIIFNLGVMEHFSDAEIVRSLSEMKRVLAPEGRIILYWPPIWGPTVMLLHSLARVRRILRPPAEQLHPPEINLFRSRRKCDALLAQADLRAISVSYGPGDLFTHVIVVAGHHS